MNTSSKTIHQLEKEELQKLKERLEMVEQARLKGEPAYTLDEVKEHLEEIISKS